MKRTPFMLTSAVACFLLVTSCSGTDTEEPEAEPSVVASETAEPTREPTTEESTPESESTTEEQEPEPTTEEQEPEPTTEEPAEENVTTEFVNANAGAAWTDYVVNATQSGGTTHLIIESTIVDPRGDNGSPEARLAVSACEAGVIWLQDQGQTEPTVSVRESDDTTFATTVGNAPGMCTEY